MSHLRFNLMAWSKRKDVNQYPNVYSRAIDVNNPEHYVLQIQKFLVPLNYRGFESVSVSAYLDKCISEKSATLFRKIGHQIMKKIQPKAQIDDHDIVFVWDIKDITALPKSHILELSMLRPDINATSLQTLKKHIYDNVLNLEDSESIIRKVVNIEDAFSGTDEMRKAAPMYEAIRELYNNLQPNDKRENGSIIPHELLEKLGILEAKDELCQVAEKHQKVYNQRWKSAKKCLEMVNIRSWESDSKKYANVVLSNEGVASGAAQLLISGLSSEVPIENIYSTVRLERERGCWYRVRSVVERLQQRFGEHCLFIHVTSGPLYGDVPLLKLGITSNESFDWLYDFQQENLI